MAGSLESVCWLRLFALSEGKERCKSIGEVYKMATSKDILNSFGKEANIVKAVALYQAQRFVRTKRSIYASIDIASV